MPDLTIAAAITRVELGLAELNINDQTNYKIVKVGPGEVEWERQYSGNPFTHGQTLVSAVMRQGTLPLSVRCKGATNVVVENNRDALCRALEQFTYNLNITIDGVSFSWKCDPANYSVDETDGAINPFFVRAKQSVVTADIPRDPISIVGSV